MKGKINIPTPEFKSFMNDVTKVLAVEGQNFSVENWKRQGYYKEGTSSFQSWQPRKREYYQVVRKGRKVKKGRKGRVLSSSKGKAILVSSGDLRLSVKGRRFSMTRALITSNLKYSARHNEGLNGMPKRTFLNDNKVLGKRLEKSVTLLMKRKGL
jgi:phage gpG-like protein